MEIAVITSLIAGVFSLATALGSVIAGPRVPGLALARQVRHLSYQLEVFSLWAAFLAGGGPLFIARSGAMRCSASAWGGSPVPSWVVSSSRSGGAVRPDSS